MIKSGGYEDLGRYENGVRQLWRVKAGTVTLGSQASPTVTMTVEDMQVGYHCQNNATTLYSISIVSTAGGRLRLCVRVQRSVRLSQLLPDRELLDLQHPRHDHAGRIPGHEHPLRERSNGNEERIQTQSDERTVFL